MVNSLFKYSGHPAEYTSQQQIIKSGRKGYGEEGYGEEREEREERRDMEKRKDIEELKRLLKQEIGFLPEGSGLDRLLVEAEWLETEGKEVLIEAGKVCPDVLIVRDGIIRVWDMDRDKERTFGFGLPGTIFISKHSFVMHLPSHYEVETCCRSTILRISEKEFRRAVEEDHQLALYMMHYALGELYSHERRNSVIHNGTAKERFRNLAVCRPMLLEKVPQKILASYLGITSEYFSVLKREILKGKR